jgi:hypothetical protein
MCRLSFGLGAAGGAAATTAAVVVDLLLDEELLPHALATRATRTAPSAQLAAEILIWRILN